MDHWKAREFQKRSTSTLLTMSMPLIVWITNGGKFFKRWEHKTTLPPSWEICMQVKKQHLELNMEWQTGSKLGKQYVKALYRQPAYLTYTECIMRSAKLDEAQAGIKIARRNINNLIYTDDTTLMTESEELKTSWWKWKRRVKELT